VSETRQWLVEVQVWFHANGDSLYRDADDTWCATVQAPTWGDAIEQGKDLCPWDVEDDKSGELNGWGIEAWEDVQERIVP
jgi:hypothetical protein